MIHIVKQGDTLETIANQYRLPKLPFFHQKSPQKYLSNFYATLKS